MAFSDIVSVMPPATWYEIPNTKMSSVYAITDPGDSRYGSEGPSSIVYDWCGAAFDTDHNKLILTGGGHTNYGGNEVYEFPLSTLTWACVTTPSTYEQDPAYGTDGLHFLTTDGNPVSTHTYDSLQYIPSLGKVFRYGGATWKSGNAANQVYLFDTTAYTWEGKSTNAAVLETATAYDAARNRIYVVQHSGLLAYDVANDTWTTLVGTWDALGDLTAEYDPVHDQLFIAAGTATAGFWLYDVANGGGLTAVTLTGDTDVSNYRAGLVWDSKRSVYTLWNGNREVWTIDPTTWVSTKVSATTGSAPTFPALCDGVYSKWQYVPAYDVFLGYTDGGGNVWVYKPGVAGSGPAPGWGDPQRQVLRKIPAAKVTGTHSGFVFPITRAILPDEMCDPSGSFAAQVNGGDIRLSLDDQGISRLPIEVVNFGLDSATGAKDAVVLIWAKLPNVTDAEDTPYYIWYHSNTTQVQPGVSDAYGRNAVWPNYIAAYHLNKATGAVDSTGNGYGFTISGAQQHSNHPIAPGSGVVGVLFNSTSTTPTLPLNQDYTITEAVYLPGVISGTKTALTINGTGGAAIQTIAIGQYAVKQVAYDDSGVATNIANSDTWSATTWRWRTIASPLGLGTQSYYGDGSLIASVSVTRRAGDGTIKLDAAANQIYYAEYLIAKGILSADRIATEYAALSSPSTFIDSTAAPQTPVVGGAIAAPAKASDAYTAQALVMAAWSDAMLVASGFSPIARVAAAITEAVLANESDGELAQALALFTGPASGNALIDALGQVSAAIAAGTAAGEAWAARANALAELVSASASGDVLSASATQALQAAVSEPTQANSAFIEGIVALAQITAPASASNQFDATSAAAPRGSIVESAAAADALIATVSVLVTLGAGANAEDVWQGSLALLGAQLTELASAAAALDARIASFAALQAAGHAADTWVGALAQLTGIFTAQVNAESIVTARAAIVATLTSRANAGSAFIARLPGNGYLIAGAITLTAALSGTITLKPN